MNTDQPVANFTIISNSMVGFTEKNEYHRNNVLIAHLGYLGNDFSWLIQVSNDTDIFREKISFNVGTNITTISFPINSSFAQENKFYYIKVNLTKISKNINFAEYFYFKVLSPESLIVSSTIKFTPTQVYRTQACSLYLNVSQNDLIIENIDVSLNLIDTNGINLPTTYLTNNNDGTFRGGFNVAATKPIGSYRYTLIAEYNGDNFDEYTSYIKILNNPPLIDSYEINNFDTDERISVLYGEDLDFEFDVSDIEGIAYVTILLINEDDDEYEISKEYEDDLEMTVRTAELITGTWDIYVSVTDIDGVSVNLDDDFDKAPQRFTIIPDIIGGIFPWVTLFIGIILGTIVSYGIIYYLKKPKYKPEVEKELIPRKIKPERKLKPEKIPKKAKPTPIEREPVSKEITEEKPEKKEPRKITPPRKIKRRLK